MPPSSSSSQQQPQPHLLQTEDLDDLTSYERSSLNSSNEDATTLVNTGGSQRLSIHSNMSRDSVPSPTLPRYGSPSASSSSHFSTTYPSPLNPSTSRTSLGYSGNTVAGGGGGTTYSGRQRDAHPLSNNTFLDSAPTLAEIDGDRERERSTRGVSSRLSRKVEPESGGDYALRRATSTGSNYRRASRPTGFWATSYRKLSGADLADSGVDERHIKLPRLAYLDGLKFIAAFIVLNGTLFDAALSGDQYSAIQRNSPLYILRSTGLGITFLLLLSGRSLATPLWDVPSSSSPPISSSPLAKPKTALISWARLTKAMLVRPFRFLLPVIVIAALQWGLGATGKLSQANAVGMNEPYWGLISSFSGLATLIFDLYTYYEQDTRAGQTFGANLWTVPWFFQSSYGVYVAHFMLGNLSSNRYWVYGLLAFFSWTTYNYFFVALLGLCIADLHAHGVLHRIRSQWSTLGRLSLHASLLALACITQFIPIVRNNINSAFAVINVQDHPELTFADSIFAFCVLFCVETSGVGQFLFGNYVMKHLGKLAAGMYLLAPSIVFALIPPFAAGLHNKGSGYGATLGLSWLILLLSGLFFSILFHLLVELPSKLLGEVVSDVVENLGVERVHPRSSMTKGGGGGAARGLKQKPVLA